MFALFLYLLLPALGCSGCPVAIAGHADPNRTANDLYSVAKSRCKTDAEREALQRKIEAGEPLHEILKDLAPEHLSFEEFD